MERRLRDLHARDPGPKRKLRDVVDVGPDDGQHLRGRVRRRSRQGVRHTDAGAGIHGAKVEGRLEAVGEVGAHAERGAKGPPLGEPERQSSVLGHPDGAAVQGTADYQGRAEDGEHP